MLRKLVDNILCSFVVAAVVFCLFWYSGFIQSVDGYQCFEVLHRCPFRRQLQNGRAIYINLRGLVLNLN